MSNDILINKIKELEFEKEAFWNCLKKEERLRWDAEELLKEVLKDKDKIDLAQKYLEVKQEVITLSKRLNSKQEEIDKLDIIVGNRPLKVKIKQSFIEAIPYLCAIPVGILLGYLLRFF